MNISSKLSNLWKICNSIGITIGSIACWLLLNVALILIELLGSGDNIFSNEFWKSHGKELFIQGVLSLLLVGIPSFVKQQLMEAKQEISDKLKLLDKCPRMIAFHTKGNVLEEKIKIIDQSKDHKWLLSRFISKMLEYAFKEFSFKISPSEYAERAKDFLSEAKEKVMLSSSYSPYVWLSELSSPNGVSAGEDEKERFFNNEIEHYPFITGQKEKLHSYYMANIASKKSERFVLLSEYDWDNLYLAERYLDEYYFLNANEKSGSEENLITYYINPYTAKLPKEHKDLLMSEATLYDGSILLNYSTKDEILSCVTDAKVERSKEIFKDARNAAIRYNALKDEIIRIKIDKVTEILQAKKIPHTLAYLFKGAENWEEYCKTERDYVRCSINILYKGLSELITSPIFPENGTFKIVEIGSGTGDKINCVFDVLGKRIESYELIDVSEELLRKAETKLREQKIDPHKIKTHLMDIFDVDDNTRNQLRIISQDSLVIIQANSSLFTENDSWVDTFMEAKAIFLTLDMYDTYKTLSKEEFYYQQHIIKLLLHPLRAFEIPIHTKIIKEKKLLSVSYSKNKLKIIFRLKDYINCLDDEQKLILNKKKTKEYKDKRNDLLQINDLVVFDSLKFSDEDSIVSYFKKLGFNSKIHIESSQKCDFAAILLTRI